MKKKLTLLSLLLAFALAAIGCSGKTDASNVLMKAQEKSQKAKSVTAKATMELKMTAGEQTVNMSSAMDMDIFSDPMKGKVLMSMDMGELGQQDTEMYLIAEGDDAGTYTNINGTWYKQAMDQEAMEKTMSSYDNSAYIEALSSCEDSLQMSEVDEGGKKCYRIEGTITGDAMKKMIDSTSLKDQLSATGTDISSFDDLGDLKMVAFVEKDTNNFYKLSIDMKDLMDKVMESTKAATGSTEEIKIDSCVMNMEYVGYDNAEDFELPEEAKNAQDMPQ